MMLSENTVAFCCCLFFAAVHVLLHAIEMETVKYGEVISQVEAYAFVESNPTGESNNGTTYNEGDILVKIATLKEGLIAAMENLEKLVKYVSGNIEYSFVKKCHIFIDRFSISLLFSY